MPNRPSLASATMTVCRDVAGDAGTCSIADSGVSGMFSPSTSATGPCCSWPMSAAADLKDASNGGSRQREQLFTRLEQHDPQQRERQRKVQRDARPFVELRLDAHGAAQPLDDALDDVHADAAAGDVGRRRPRAEAGLEDQVEKLLGRPSIDLARGRHAPLDGHRAQHLQVDAAPVVFQRDQDAIALLLGREHQLAGRRLADALADGRRLDAVVDGVANEMNQRLGDLLDDFLVELGLAAANREVDFLVEACARGRAPRAGTRRTPTRPAASSAR